MSSDGDRANVRKVTVSLPDSLIDRLDSFIPRRKRSKFIAIAIQEQLALLEQLEALEETAGLWTDENYPEFLTEADIDRWISELRGGWTRPEATGGKIPD